MLPDWNALEWGGFWLYGSLLLFVLLWAWQGCVKAARWLGRRMEAVERDGAEPFEPYSICFCVQCNGQRNPLQDKGGPS